MPDNTLREALEKIIRERHEQMKAQNPDIRDLGEHELKTHSVLDKPESKTLGGNPRMMKKAKTERSLWSDNYTVTTEGAIHGTEVKVESSIYGELPVKQFLGVPYAKAPVGELRFKKTEKPFKYFGIRECTNFTSGSMQLSALLDDPFADPGFSGTYHTEDSLYLNIWSPAEKLTEKLPIVVWV
ncbi:MAG: carboxylesterase family protein, partial [Clostridia bacterium]|nr:carboxylesterase family protein [Clostridia bacterium]